MTTDLVRSYLKEIGRYPLLTKEQEISYAQQVQAMISIEKAQEAINSRRNLTAKEADILFNKSKSEIELILHKGKIAKEKLIVSNLRLVVVIAKKYQNRNMEFLDLIQEGTLGLARGVEKFDPTIGCKFSTYAYWWIAQGITRAIANSSRNIRLPINLTEKINKIKRICQQLSQKLGRSPTVKEIAYEGKFKVEKVEEYIKLSLSTISLDVQIGEDETCRLLDFMESQEVPLNEQLDARFLRDGVNDILETLTLKQKKVMIMRYGLHSGKEETLDQIGQQMGCSRERVRQLQFEGIKSIKRRYQDIRD